MKLPILLVLSAAFLLPLVSSAGVRRCRVSVVLVGSTGDLAKRYLWPAIFSSFMERECQPPDLAQGCGLLVLGGSRRAVEVEGRLHSLLGGVHCKTLSCEICLQKFVNSTLRMKIGEEEDYNMVSETLSETYRMLNCTEVGRVFYLSVPPSAYVSIVRSIHTHGWPDGGAWLRVVLEKPFGNDLESARLLASELEQYLDEEEVYRVDHYLGKPGIQQILPFRQTNSEKLQRLWTKAHIQHIEVCVKERLDVQGRSGFFDAYGIIRDMHQNHLTEVLARVLMDLTPGGDRGKFLEQKMSFLGNLWPPTLRHSILGQYDGYLAHLAPGRGESGTPTYASVALYSRDPKWRGVSFLLTAGKQLDERKALARVVFKKWTFSLVDDKNTSCPAEIVFVIQDEELDGPGILLSSCFSDMGLELGGSQWKTVEVNGCSYLFVSPVDRVSANAYVSLVGDVLNGRKDNFVDTDSLLSAWKVWDPLLGEIQSANNSLELIPYSPQDLTSLDFSIKNSRLKANTSSSRVACETKIIPHNGIPAVVGSKEVVASCLAKEIYMSASASVAKSGVFHLALPGGRSPKLLFKSLSLEYAEEFPWRYTHIWQTDERCVLANHTESNWNQIDKLLLSQVSIPYHQLHPMPIALQSGVCELADGGCGLYERQLHDVIGSLTLDHVVLGVGRDGHTASLFPPSEISSPVNSSQWVWLVRLQDTAAVTVKERMTLSYDALLSARAVSVVVMGGGKGEVVRKIMTGEGGDTDMPVVKLMEKAMGQLTFYIAT